MTALTELIVSQLMTKFVSHRDAIIADAIQKRIGDFEIDSLRGRLTRVVFQHEDGEVWYLDKEPICEFFPAKFEMDGNILKASQNYLTPPPSNTAAPQ